VQRFCVDEALFEACVSIIVDPDYTEDIDFFEIRWGDGSITTVPGSLDPDDQFHEYDFSDFVGTCTYSIEDIAIRLDTYLEDGTSINSAFFPTFVNFPIAIINNPPAFACVGEEVCFDDNSCPTEQLSLVGWSLSDGTPLPDNGCYTFDEPGTYTVVLEVENPCGTDQAMHNITVVEPATADAEIAEGAANPGPGPDFTVCLVNDTATVVLDGTASQNESSYFWEVISGGASGYNWVIEPPGTEPTQGEQTINFTQEGVYEIQLTTNNECGQEAEDVLTITVESGGVSLDPQPDICVSLDYTPSPLLDDVVYTINDEEVSDFPVTLGVGTYIVKVNGVSSFCATVPACDTFSVLDQDIATITSPDTTLCSLDASLTYSAMPSEGGIWRIDGDVFDGTIDPSIYDPGTYAITYGNDPCLTTDTVFLTIVGAGLDLPDDTELCVDGDPEQFSATPPGGTFSGTGITPGGLFDPTSVTPGSYTITYELVNNELPSCSNLDSFMVTVTELTASFSVSSCDGNTLCFEIEDAGSGISASWDFGGTGTANGLSPCHTFPDSGSYDVTLMIQRGACSASFTETVVIEPPPVAGFTLAYDPSLCSELEVAIDNQATGGSLEYEWYLNGELVSESPQPNSLILEATESPTSFTILQVVSNACGSMSAEETIVVQPQPVSRFGTDLSAYCSGDTVLLANTSTGLPDTYEWIFNGNVVGTDSIEPVITYQTIVTDTLSLCLVTTNACGVDTLCTELVFRPTDVNAFFNLDPAVVCQNDSVRVSNFSTLGVEVFYDLGDGNTTAQPNFAYQYNEPGEYLIRQQAFGCGFDAFEQTVTVVEAPAVSWDNPAVGCPGDTLSFTNTSPEVMDYFWDFGDGSTSGLENPRHRFQLPGVYEVCLTVFESGVVDCDATLCQEVTIYDPIEAGFEVSDSVCAGAAISIANSSSELPVSCFYDFGDGNFSNECAPVHEYADAGSYLITQILEGSRGCLDTAQQSIFVRPLPEPAFQVEVMDACTPDSVAFTNQSTLSTSYLWDFGDGTTSVLTEPVHVYTSPGSYTVSLTAFRNGICAATVTQVVTIAESPTAVIDIDDDALCANSSNVFSSTGSGPIENQQWDMGDGITAFTETVTHQYGSAGVYSVRLIVSTAENCSDTATLELEVAPAIAVAASLLPITCAEGSDGAISLDYTDGTSPFSTNWSNGEVGNTIDGLPAGTYTVESQDGNGCVWDSTFVVPDPPPLSAAISGTIVTCAGGADGTLTVDSVTGGEAPYQIAWEDAGSEMQRTGLSAGIYTLNIIDDLGCTRSQEVVVFENPPITFVDSTLEISCFRANDGAITIDGIEGGTPPYETFLSGPQSANGVGISRFDSLGAGEYLLEVIDFNGCSGVSEHVLLEPSPAQINVLDTVFNIQLGEERQTTTIYNASDPAFTWLPTDGLSCADCPEPVVSPLVDTRYIVQLTDNRGCTAFDTLLVFVDATRSIWLPEAFTPNLDNRNDFFTVRSRNPLAIDRIAHFRIMDRWGGVLFERRDLPPNDDRFGWDGSKDGTPLAPGTYVYEVEVYFFGLPDPQLIQGDVLLIR
jgi:gliding motility-associated-like protein